VAKRAGKTAEDSGAPPAKGTADRILAAAITAFGRHGYESARLEDIAAEAGITRPSLLHHFASKDDLYAASLRHAFGELERALEKALLREGDYEARLRHLIEALVEYEREHLGILAIVLRGAMREGDEIARSEVERSFVPLVDRIEAFVRFGAGARLPAEFPVRAAILQLMYAHLVRSAMGKTGQALWKGDAHSWLFAKILLGGAA
jgi:AcrR family transcriptional regulator